MKYYKIIFVIFSLLMQIACSITRSDKIIDKVKREEVVSQLLNQTVNHLRNNDQQSLKVAKEILELARDLDPTDARILDGLGAIEFRRKNFQLAKKFFKQAIASEPIYDRPYVHMALIAKLETDNLAAYDLLMIAIKLNPLNSQARLLLAELLRNSGSFKQANQQELRAQAIKLLK